MSFDAIYPPMKVPLKIDITTGDKITPRAITYQFNLLFESRKINIFAYNLETILAEKLETIISRGDQNTRPRDYYDIFILHKLQWQNVDAATLKTAFLATAKKRNTTHVIERHKEILEAIRRSDIMNNHWLSYQKDFNYAKDIEFSDVCRSVSYIISEIDSL